MTLFRTKTLFSTMQWAILLVGGFLIFLYALNAMGRPAREREAAASEAQKKVAIADQLALEDSVGNPAAFQSRCGTATTVRQGIIPQDAKNIDFDRIHNPTTLIYKESPTEEMHVIFTGDKTIPLLFREHLENKIHWFVPYDGLVEMGCVKK
jgi:hypothetical protein